MPIEAEPSAQIRIRWYLRGLIEDVMAGYDNLLELFFRKPWMYWQAQKPLVNRFRLWKFLIAIVEIRADRVMVHWNIMHLYSDSPPMEGGECLFPVRHKHREQMVTVQEPLGSTWR